MTLLSRISRLNAVALCLCGLLLGATAYAQTSGAAADDERATRRQPQDFPEGETLLPEDESTERRVLSYEAGMNALEANNLSIAIARQSLEEAAIVDQQARSIFVPSVDLTAQVTYNDRQVTLSQGSPFAPLLPYLNSVADNDPSIQQFYDNNPEVVDPRVLAAQPAEDVVVRPRTDFTAQLVVTQPLFTARIFPARRLADIIEQQSEASIEVAVQQQLTAYNQLYFQAVGLQRSIEVAHANVENAQIAYDQARILYEEQAGTEFDATRALVNYRTALRDLENARTAYRLTVDAIATLIREEADFDVSAPTDLSAPSDIDEVMQTAMQQRPDIEAADLNVRQFEARADEARARYLPEISGQALGSAQRVTAFNDRTFRWSLSLIASWSLYDGGANARERRRQQISAANAELERMQIEDQIRSEIRQGFLELENQRTLLQRAAAEAELAQLNYELTVEARELGAATALDVEVARNQLYQTELAEADAETNLQAAIYNLYIIQGTAQSALR